MNTKDQAYATGEMIRLEIIKAGLSDNRTLELINSDFIKNTQISIEQNIDNDIKIAQEEVLPSYDTSRTILYRQGRTARNFETEHKRLWRRAVILHTEHTIAALPCSIREALQNPDSGISRETLEHLIADQLENTIIPALNKHKTPGDDFYLFTHELMHHTDKDLSLDVFSETGKSPAEINITFYGIFGLLLQAENSKQKGEITQAYSFLLDATHLIGMHEGARYVTERMTTVSESLLATRNSKKRHEKTDEIKIRATTLFYALQPINKKTNQKEWKSAKVACDEVWGALCDEYRRTRKDLSISSSTILTLCQKLQRGSKKGASLDIHVTVRMQSEDSSNQPCP